jgi:PAS domain S-box-containing protein
MEQRVLSEFDKYSVSIVDAVTARLASRISDEDVNFIIDLLENSVQDLIQLMREGKSAHEKFFSDIILNSIDAIIGIDNEYKIFLWNKGAEKIYGYTKDEAMGKDFSLVIPPQKLKEGEREFLINEVKDKGFIANYETERFSKDGRPLNVSISRFPIFNEQKEMIGSVGIVRDVTRVKALERELREKENLALIGEVVSSIAHNLSNPLNIISGNADYLLLDKNEKDHEYEELKTILDEATRITKSIRLLLNFSRPLKIQKENNDINALINAVTKNSKYVIGDKRITFRKNLAEIESFKFDFAQMQDVITNIVTNAIQAIPSVGEIKIKTAKTNDLVMIEITDNGSGISKENIDKIFQPFYSSKEYGKGTGLGLSIAKRIVKEHKGDIIVKSTISKGTIFTITLPLF